jgi:hypothetical protein
VAQSGSRPRAGETVSTTVFCCWVLQATSTTTR